MASTCCALSPHRPSSSAAAHDDAAVTASIQNSVLSLCCRPLPAAVSNASVLNGIIFFGFRHRDELPPLSHTRCHGRCARGVSPPSRLPPVARPSHRPSGTGLPLTVASSFLSRQELEVLYAAADPAAASWPAAGLLSARSRGWSACRAGAAAWAASPAARRAGEWPCWLREGPREGPWSTEVLCPLSVLCSKAVCRGVEISRDK